MSTGFTRFKEGLVAAGDPAVRMEPDQSPYGAVASLMAQRKPRSAAVVSGE